MPVSSEIGLHTQNVLMTSSDAIQILVETYGITASLSEAGFMLPDGRFLDFSGRHEDRELDGGRDHYRNRRLTDHRDLPLSLCDWATRSFGQTEDNTHLMYQVMNLTGIIRIQSVHGFDFSVKPTLEQATALFRIYAGSRDPYDISAVSLDDHRKPVTTQSVSPGEPSSLTRAMIHCVKALEACSPQAGPARTGRVESPGI